MLARVAAAKRHHQKLKFRGERLGGFKGKVTASMIEWSGATALLLRLQSGGHALEAEAREKVLELLEERLRNDRDR